MSLNSSREDYLTDLVNKYSDILLKISFTYVKNMSDAQDMVHNVYVKLLQRTPVFDNDEHEKAWLIRVTMNRCKNYLKSTWYSKSAPLDSSLPFTEKEHEVLEAVLSLPEKYRSVITLYYSFGYDIKEIAYLLKRKESTVSSQLIRGRKKLKTILKEEFDYE